MHDANGRSQAAVAARPPRGRLGRKVRRLLLVNLVVFSTAALLGELGARLFWHPRFWVHCEDWVVGSGQGRAGKKWWPNTSYLMESKEFRVRFRSDDRGYRARPTPPRTADPYRVAFVGDSFTEAVQVEYAETFVARLGRGLGERSAAREVVAENYGVAGTGFFEYWHRITHDVFRPDSPAPEALVLCVYPGNDFTDDCPDDGFEPDGRPKREYFREPGWARHALTWLNLESKFANFVFQSITIATWRLAPPTPTAPVIWWNDPVLAAAANDAPGIRPVRALVRAIRDECGRHGTRLVILIVPAHNYAATGGKGPLPHIFAAWGIDSPVIDVAAQALATPVPSRLVFFCDGHLNPSGHEFVAATALDPLGQALGLGKPAAPAFATGSGDRTRLH
jgi:hypothetical protein